MTPGDGSAEANDPALAAKQTVGRKAAEFVTDGMTVGLGTGSTVHFTITALGERSPDIVCTATSVRTAELAASVGLRVVEPDELGSLDIAIDGADEVDPGLNLTKGGGGAHTREKIVASMAARFIVVVDASKPVEALGPFGTPLEVLDFAPGVVTAAVKALGAGSVTTRDGRSDNDNLLMDAHFERIRHPQRLATELSAIPGIVEHGIFPGSMVERALVANEDGSVRELVH